MEEKKLTGYPSIDMPWLKYYEVGENKIELPNKSIYEFAKESNEDNLKNVAIDMRVSSNDFKRGIKLTYGNFFKKIENMAKASTVLGVKPDEIIPILLPNLPEARTFIYSNSYIGATSYPISPLLPEKNLESIIKENGIKNLVVFSGFYDKYEKVIKNCDLDSVIYVDGTESLPDSIRMLKSIKDKISGTNKIPTGDNILSWNEYIGLRKMLNNEIKPYYYKDHIAAIIGTSGTNP